ncbi:nucleotide pyrophosphohydrolase [Sphingobacterium endophyticum]|uniref:nucleotide pyrophosphohydrolase n=1 Tax=Sphingobacterium endophyticum TaxID=2546448 RepID=UPI0012E16BE6|nr:nucleotide pyrophosphohydrolase [Sphingobacterium endophyticum]
MIEQIKKDFFDENYISGEQIPRYFRVSFKEVGSEKKNEVQVIFNGSKQLGDIINDNSYDNDYYRYHDIFHYSFAALLGWSPCGRAMMKRKRKSNPLIDEIEDGARAIITEEAISMIIFNEAKRKKFFKGKSKISKTTLRIIREMTENFEVNVRTSEEWEYAILQSYAAFRFLISNQGGIIEFDTVNRKLNHLPLL